MLLDMPEQDGGCVCVDFHDEAKMLDVIFKMGAQWGFRCAKCDIEIAAETGWKPHAIIGFHRERINQVTIALYCGRCGVVSPQLDRAP